MFRAVWHTASGERSVIGVVLGQRGDDLITAGLSAAKQLVDRLAANASTSADPSGALGVPRPALTTYRRHIENHIRAGDTTLS
jgi:hypothetical protein